MMLMANVKGLWQNIEIVDPFIITAPYFRVSHVAFGPCIINILDLWDTHLMQSHQAHMKIALEMISFELIPVKSIPRAMGARVLYSSLSFHFFRHRFDDGFFGSLPTDW